ncbi:MAG: TVP38/TMEM64 family protein [Rhodospirillaceae bacterium]|nr:TVP38/TMEM64 family protein [Rhodospirillaceae bacterium]
MSRPDSAARSVPPARRRLVVLVAFALVVAAVFASGAGEMLSLDALRANQDRLRALVADHRPLAMAGYMAVYVAATAFSVPGAVWLTIAGGFVFGALAASALTVVAATIGAVVVFLLARYALADLFRAKAGPFAARMEDGFRRNAFSYMLVLRLVPLFPFFLVNLAPAFLGVPLRVFALGTLIGIIPGTFVFATLGAGLGDALAAGAAVNPGAALMQPTVIGGLLGLAALAMIPVVYKRFVRNNA